jgi:exopolysaccharide production protein ExoY
MSLDEGACLLRTVDAAETCEVGAFFGSGPNDLCEMAYPAARATLGHRTEAVLDDPLNRVFDALFALVLLIAVAPALLVLIVVLQIDSPGPIFFVQRRVGRFGILFPCIKLRTMVVDARERLEALLASSPEARSEWEADHKLRDDPRVTKFGRFARLYSLDELPQLVNILAGHMSIVGPRPIVQEEIWRYGSHFADYCSVRPGLTGLWQVSGRNNTTYEQRVMLDAHYARRKSLRLDFTIISRTFAVVAGARGAY